MIKKKDIAFIGILAIFFMIYLFRAPYGVVSNDESLYLAIPYRILTGDPLLSAEWNLSQLSALILLPFFYVYHLIFNSYEGIYLVFRYFYIVVNVIIALWSWITLKKNNYGISSYIIPLIYFLFVPYKIMAFSYNSIALACFYVIVIILLKNKNNNLDKVILGILLAIAILCIPYFIIIYSIYILFVIYHLIRKKENDLFNIKTALLITAGSLIVFIYFLIMIMHNNSISDILINLEYMLNDPTHGSNLDTSYFDFIVGFILEFKYLLLIQVVIALLSFIKKYQKAAIFAEIIFSILMVVYFAIFRSNGFGMAGIGTNAIMIPFAFVSLLLLIHSKSIGNKMKITIGFICVYIILAFIASNQGMYIVGMTSSLLTYLFFILIDKYFKHKINLLLLLIICSLFCLSELLIMTRTFHDDKIWNLNSKINCGTFNGIITTEENANNYEIIYNDLKQIDLKDKEVLFFKNLPYGYLETNSLVGSYSVWNETDSLNSYMFESYYNLHEDKIPEYIYIINNDIELIKDDINQYTNNYEKRIMDSGAILLVRR